MHYVKITEVLYGETIDPTMVETLLDLDLIDAQIGSVAEIAIAEKDCEAFRAMLRLMVELEINAPGVATIMHMRRRIEEMQRELRTLRMLVHGAPPL